jgi:micrococcal nuclease
MKRILLLAVAFVVTIAGPFAFAEVITAEQAAQHVGEIQTVRGVVASATYAFGTKGRPTFLNLDKPYPGAIFTILIWGSDREKFPVQPDKAFRGKTVRVTGKITVYRGTPEIVVHDPAQIVVEIQSDPNPR